MIDDLLRERGRLKKLFPILTEGKQLSCPVCTRSYHTRRSGVWTIMGVMVHLNDFHRWPRTDKDRNADNQNLPTIHGWLKEEAEKNGWDLTCGLT